MTSTVDSDPAEPDNASRPTDPGSSPPHTTPDERAPEADEAALQDAPPRQADAPTELDAPTSPEPPPALLARTMEGPWGRTIKVLLCIGITALVVALAWGIYRNNRLAGVFALLAVHVYLLAVACLDRWRWQPRDDRLWSIWVPRSCYPAGLILGGIVAVDSSNVFPRGVGLVLILGVHAVAAAAWATIIGHFIHGQTSLPRPWHLVVSIVIAFAATSAAIRLDGEAVYQNLGVSTTWYSALVVITVVTAASFSLYRMRKAQNDRLPGLSVLVGYSCLVGGAAVLVGSLVLMAFWRNNDPVAGPPIHELPVIRGITGEYVALGDSYAAGEGLRPFEAFTGDNRGELGNGCHRSHLAYSQLLRFEAPVPATRFVACSGAVISDIFKPYLTGDAGDDDRLRVPEQVPIGVRRDVGLVTISIGGNDAVFSAIVRHCFLQEHCLEKRFTPPADDLDRAVDLPDPLPLDDWAAAVLRGGGAQTVESKIHAVYARLRTTYPNARIIVIGYPYLFPGGGAPIADLTDCQTILRRFDETEREQVRERQDDFNQMLHDEAVRAGLEFVSPTAGWAGHEPCGSTREQYTNSIKPFLVTPLTGLELGDGGSFHPTDAGQRELARLITCYLAEHPGGRPSADAPGATPIGHIGNEVDECLGNAS